MSGRTLAQAIWHAHCVSQGTDSDLLYVDLHLLNEVTSPIAFDQLERRGLTVRRPELTLAVEDHNVPTDDGVVETGARDQLDALREHCTKHSIPLVRMGQAGQGIVHVTAPEQGLTRPGMVVACGDSHTTTHGAFGALALGIGTSQITHVLATQSLHLSRLSQMRLTVDGTLGPGVTAKDLALAIVRFLGTTGAVGCVLELAGEGIRSLSMPERMTVCNMTVEAGARAGIIAPDAVTLDWLRDRPGMSTGAAWEAACADWLALRSAPDAVYDHELTLDARTVVPTVSWGTHPAHCVPIDGHVPSPADAGAERALAYMDLTPGTAMRDIPIDAVFIGSCTNGRLEDLRQAAEVVQGRRVASGIRALVVPGSWAVRSAAEAEGLDAVFRDAGFEWRAPGCSMCLGMNSDRLSRGERCVSTSNRNYEGRQGPGGRTHLTSPAAAAASAVAGTIAAPRDLP